MAPTAESHGLLSAAFADVLRGYVRSRKLGRVYGAETGFYIQRASHSAFISARGLSPGRPSAKFPEIASDVVVEVVSPSDSATAIQRKIEQWLDAGIRLVSAAYPDTESVAACRPGSRSARLKITDTLDDGDVLPGISVPLPDLFA